MRIPYRFTLDEERHKDLIDFLDSVPRPLRGGYCIEGLKLLKNKMSVEQVSGKTGHGINMNFKDILNK